MPETLVAKHHVGARPTGTDPDRMCKQRRFPKTVPDTTFDGYTHFHCKDPFGNRPDVPAADSDPAIAF